jgi:cysteinyl-tRNA synthetase
MIDGVKMSKSLGNFYRIDDIIEKGYSPLALRYLFMTAHYRTPLNFTWSSLSAAQTAYSKLKEFASSTFARKTLSKEKAKKINEFRAKFLAAVNNDLNFPQALAVVWEMIKSNVPDYDKQDLLLDWDQVLGLDLANSAIIEQVPDEVKKLAGIREGLRKEGKFVLADEVRVKIAELGWEVKDTPRGSVFKKN